MEILFIGQYNSVQIHNRFRHVSIGSPSAVVCGRKESTHSLTVSILFLPHDASL